MTMSLQIVAVLLAFRYICVYIYCIYIISIDIDLY